MTFAGAPDAVSEGSNEISGEFPNGVKVTVMVESGSGFIEIIREARGRGTVKISALRMNSREARFLQSALEALDV